MAAAALPEWVQTDHDNKIYWSAFIFGVPDNLKNNRFACQIWRKFDFSFSFHVVKFS
jgi:hypothetical protein